MGGEMSEEGPSSATASSTTATGKENSDSDRKNFWRALWSSQWMIAIAGGLVVTIGGGLIVFYLTSSAPPSAKASAAGIIPAGYYVNGTPGTPHWFILVAASQGTEISGSLGFVGQDGQTGEAQTFSGQLQDNLLTFNFSRSGAQTGQASMSSHPPSIYLGACLSYLNLAMSSLTQCNFHHAADIQGDQS